VRYRIVRLQRRRQNRLERSRTSHAESRSHQKTHPLQQSRRLPAVAATPGKRELLLKLAQELQEMTIESMEGLGVSRKEQMVTYRRATRGSAARNVRVRG